MIFLGIQPTSEPNMLGLKWRNVLVLLTIPFAGQYGQGNLPVTEQKKNIRKFLIFGVAIIFLHVILSSNVFMYY
jgi:hypothetical protein